MEPNLNSWRWNELEDAALDELQDARLVVLYLRGLRRRMDYSTGVVRAVSEKTLRWVLEERPDPGSHREPFIPSRHQIQKMLKRLELVGLVERLPKQRKTDSMLLRLPLACAGLNRPEEEGTRRAQGGGHKAGHSNGPVIAGTSVVPMRTAGHKEGTRGRAHYSGKSGNNPKVKNTYLPGRVVAVDGFVPSESDVGHCDVLGEFREDFELWLEEWRLRHREANALKPMEEWSRLLRGYFDNRLHGRPCMFGQ